MSEENEIAADIVDAAFKVHVKVGPGLLESAYEQILAYELTKRGRQVARQVPIHFVYEELKIDQGYRADLMVDDKVVVELKSVENLAPVHKKQTLTYVKLSEKRLGLLINFGGERIKDNIVRIANQLQE